MRGDKGKRYVFNVYAGYLLGDKGKLYVFNVYAGYVRGDKGKVFNTFYLLNHSTKIFNFS